uniref:Complex I-9kD n=1 Tax=Rhodnius prolixus TaxID=13249 RepID=T1HES3_RHOPR
MRNLGTETIATSFLVLNLTRNYSNGAASTPASKQVTGLSAKVLKDSPVAVGPGAAKQADYKNPEYFCYHKLSYFEAEIELQKFRLPQPSSLQTK